MRMTLSEYLANPIAGVRFIREKNGVVTIVDDDTDKALFTMRPIPQPIGFYRNKKVHPIYRACDVQYLGD